MILVFGKLGQVAQELGKLKDTILLDRNQANLTDLTACREAIMKFKPYAVLNAAAYTAVDTAEEEEALATVINGEAPGIMAITCAELNIPLVHISTDYVFDGSGRISWNPYDTPKPKNAYGRSKLKGEAAILASGCSYAILRTSWVFSAHRSNFVKTMLKLSQTKSHLSVVDDQVGGPTYARDIAKVSISIAKQISKDKKKSGIYHFSGKPDVSWCQFANEIFLRSGRKTIAQPILTLEHPTPAVRPLNSRLNCNLTYEVFNIPCPYWRDGLEETLSELETNYDTA